MDVWMYLSARIWGCPAAIQQVWRKLKNSSFRPHRGEEVREVRSRLAIEGLFQGDEFVAPGAPSSKWNAKALIMGNHLNGSQMEMMITIIKQFNHG